MHLDRAVLAGGAAGGDLHIGAHADAELPAGTRRPASRLLGPQLRVAGRLHGPVEREDVVAAVVGRADQRRVREHIGGQEVAAAQLDGIDLQLVGRHVHDALEVRGSLRPAGAAERPHRCRVGDGHGHVEGELRDSVDALGHVAGRAHRQPAAEAAVRTGVPDHPGVHAGDATVAGEAHLDVLHLTAAVGQRDQVLRPCLHPGHGPAQAAGRRQCHRVLRGDPGLAAEAAADVRGDDAHLLLGDVQQAAGERPEQVGHLRGDVHGQLRALAGDDGDGVALHRHNGDALVDEAAAHDDVGAFEHVPVVGVEESRGQVRPQLVELHGRTGFQRRLGVDHGGQRLVVDHDRVGGVGRLGCGVRQHGDHGIAHEADLALGQRWPGAGLVQGHAERVEGGDAEVGVDQRRCHARHGERRRERPPSSITAWACGERTRTRWSSPGPSVLPAMLPMNVPRPRRSSGSSTRTTSVPSSDPGMLATLRSRQVVTTRRRCRPCRRHCLHHQHRRHRRTTPRARRRPDPDPRPRRPPAGHRRSAVVGRRRSRLSVRSPAAPPRTHCEMLCQLWPGPRRSMKPERSSTPRGARRARAR